MGVGGRAGVAWFTGAVLVLFRLLRCSLLVAALSGGAARAGIAASCPSCSLQSSSSSLCFLVLGLAGTWERCATFFYKK